MATNTKKTTAKKPAKNVVRLPGYSVRRKIDSETEMLYAQLLTNKFGFDYCGECIRTKRGLKAFQGEMRKMKITRKVEIENLGFYKAEVTNLALSFDRDRSIYVTIEVSISRMVTSETGVQEFVIAPLYLKGYGSDTPYDVMETIVDEVGNALTDTYCDDFSSLPEAQKGEDLQPNDKDVNKFVNKILNK